MALSHASRPAPSFAEIEGRLEWQIRGNRGDGIRLVSALLGEEAALALPVAERDRLMGAVYSEVFGPRVLASRVCAACGEPYDFDFLIADVEAELDRQPRPTEVDHLDAAGRAVLTTGHRLRPPTLADEVAVSDLPLEAAEAALLSRCVEAPEGGDDAALDRDVAEQVLEWLSPITDVDLVGTCPECGATDATRFSIEHYVLRALAADRRQLLREVHLIATAYGWAHDAILGLARDDRRQLAALVEADRRGGRGWA
jgi:hypothetical protein